MRTEGQLKAGQFYCPPTVVDLIATHIAPAPSGARAADPFGGDGRTLARLCEQVGIPVGQRYLAELQGQDAATARAIAGHVVHCCTYTELSASRELAGLVWTNPPFDYQGWLGRTEERDRATHASERDEVRALQRLLNKSALDLLQPGAAHVVITPLHVMQQQDAMHLLARWHDDWMVATFPEEVRQFGEAIFIGVKRTVPLVDADLDAALHDLNAALDADAILPLEAAPRPRYTLPQPLTMQPRWRNRAISRPAAAQQTILATGGVWTSSEWQQRLRRLKQPAASPLTILQPDLCALLIAAGVVNGQDAIIDGERVIIKGTTLEEVVISTKEEIRGTTKMTEKTSMSVGTPQLSTFTETGAFHVYTGGSAIAELIARNGNGDALIAAVNAAAPPRYDPAQPNQEWWDILSRIYSSSGRRLPGAAHPGLNARQKHSVMAAMEALLHPDPYTGYQLPGVLLGWEPRCGKTPSTITMVEALRKLGLRHPRSSQRAFTAIVAAPGLVVGDLRQLKLWQAGKVPKAPEWYAAWADILPDWYITILESPAQVAAFFQHAQDYPDQAHVGMMTLSTMSLGSGWEIAAPMQVGRLWHGLHQRADAAYEVVDWDGRQLAADAASVDDDDVVLDEGQAPPPATPTPGISLRTQRRDALLKPTYRPARYGEVVCPDCARVQRLSTGDARSQALARSAIKSVDQGTCQWCGAVYAHHTRTYNSVPDKRLPIFRQWQDDYAEAARPVLRRDGTPVTTRAIPWGTRPTSNPRMPLGTFIDAHYSGAVDVLVIDEIHKCKGRDTAVGRAMGALINASYRTIGLTGTVFSGYADSVFAILWHLRNPLLHASFGWDDVRRFVREYGLHKEVTITRREQTAGGKFNGKAKTQHETIEMPGITTRLAQMVLMQTVNVQLVEMGFQLVPYTERAVQLPMDADVARGYAAAAAEFKTILRDCPRAMGSGAQMLLQYPLRADDPKRLVIPNPDPDSDLPPTIWTPQRCDVQLRPHDRWLADYVVAQRQQGRRVLVYMANTGTDDLMPRCEQALTDAALEQHGYSLRTARLYSQGDARGVRVKPGARDAWFAAQAAAGVDIVFCNPQLVDVGISLLDFPSIVFLQIPYSLYTVDQAKKRPWGPMQTQPVEVTFLAYQATMGAAALALIARKSAALAALKGSMLTGGIANFDAGMSLFAALAESLQKGQAEQADLNALFADASSAINASMQDAAEAMIACDLTPVQPALLEPEPVIEPVIQTVRITIGGPSVPDAPRHPTLFDSVTPPTAPRRPRAIPAPAGPQQLSLFG